MNESINSSKGSDRKRYSKPVVAKSQLTLQAVTAINPISDQSNQ